MKRTIAFTHFFHGLLIVCLSISGSAVYAQDILIGQVTAYTGNLAPTGNDYRRGLEVWFEQVNAKGGIKGRKVKLVTADDGYKSEETVKQAKAMVENNDLVAFAGFLGTGNVEALLKSKLLENHNIPLIGARTGGVIAHHPFLFHLRANYRDEVHKMIEHAATIGLKNIGVFYQDDAFGKTGLEAAETFAKEFKVNIVTKAGYEKNTTKVEAAVEAMVKADPQAIIMASNTAASAEFIKQLREKNSTAYLFVQSVTDGEQLAQKISDKFSRGVVIAQVMPNPYKRNMPVIREFQEHISISKVEGVKVNYTTLEGYLTGRLLTTALNRANKISRADLIKTLEGLHKLDLNGFIVDYSPLNHAGSQYVELSVVSSGGKVLQ